MVCTYHLPLHWFSLYTECQCLDAVENTDQSIVSNNYWMWGHYMPSLQTQYARLWYPVLIYPLVCLCLLHDKIYEGTKMPNKGVCVHACACVCACTCECVCVWSISSTHFLLVLDKQDSESFGTQQIQHTSLVSVPWAVVQTYRGLNGPTPKESYIVEVGGHSML